MFGYDPEKVKVIEELKKMQEDIQVLRMKANGLFYQAFNQPDDTLMPLAKEAWRAVHEMEVAFNKRMALEQIDKRLVGTHL